MSLWKCHVLLFYWMDHYEIGDFHDCQMIKPTDFGDPDISSIDIMRITSVVFKSEASHRNCVHTLCSHDEL